MNRTSKIAGVALTAAATIAPLSGAQAEPTPSIITPCEKTVAASWTGRGWATVKAANGTVYTINSGNPTRMCPGWLYVPSGYDGQAWTGGTSVSGYNKTVWTTTGNHAFTSKQKDPNTGTLWVKIY